MKRPYDRRTQRLDRALAWFVKGEPRLGELAVTLAEDYFRVEVGQLPNMESGRGWREFSRLSPREQHRAAALMQSAIRIIAEHSQPTAPRRSPYRRSKRKR